MRITACKTSFAFQMLIITRNYHSNIVEVKNQVVSSFNIKLTESK